MKRRLTPLLVLLILAMASTAAFAQSSSLAKKLQGSWRLDKDRIIAQTPEAKNLSRKERNELKAYLTDIRLTFDMKTQTVTTHLDGRLQDSTLFTILSESGKTMVLKIGISEIWLTLEDSQHMNVCEDGDPDSIQLYVRTR